MSVPERVGPLHGVEGLPDAAAHALHLTFDVDGGEWRALPTGAACEVAFVDACEEQRTDATG
jgi:hypothetical protein